MSVCLSVSPSLCLSVSPSVSLSLCLSVCLSLPLSVCLSVCLQKMAQMSRPNLLSCYQRIGSLNEKLPHLQERFSFCNVSSLIHSAQIDLQQVELTLTCSRRAHTDLQQVELTLTCSR